MSDQSFKRPMHSTVASIVSAPKPPIVSSQIATMRRCSASASARAFCHSSNPSSTTTATSSALTTDSQIVNRFDMDHTVQGVVA